MTACILYNLSLQDSHACISWLQRQGFTRPVAKAIWSGISTIEDAESVIKTLTITALTGCEK